MYKALHRHHYEDLTNTVMEHDHKLSGITSKDPDFKGHVHYMSGYTSEDQEHVHYYAVITGPEINVEEGHVHFFQGFTTVGKKHFHIFYGYTSVHSHY